MENQTSLTLDPISLPVDTLAELTAIAKNSDLIIFGEIHGTKEVPQLVRGLLEHLKIKAGYGTLALELPCSEQQNLIEWGQGKGNYIPRIFAEESVDGRANLEVLALIREAIRGGWHICLFDPADSESWSSPAKRDQAMADIFLIEWQQKHKDTKALGICGSLHSRLSAPAGGVPPGWPWPSFAANIRLKTKLRVSSLLIEFNKGTCFNDGLKDFYFSGNDFAEPFLTQGEPRTGHDAILHLPKGTAATFYSK